MAFGVKRAAKAGFGRPPVDGTSASDASGKAGSTAFMTCIRSFLVPERGHGVHDEAGGY